MTQKYLYVRRELYEQNPAKKLHLRRSFTDMARLFKWLLWILLIAVAGCVIWIAILMVKDPSSPIILIPMTLCTIAAIATLIPREKFLYNEFARQEELAHIQSNYQQYVMEVRKILEAQGIKSPEQILSLQKECETSLSAHTEKYNKIGNKTYDLLIGVPLGAFVAGIIYADKTVGLNAIFFIIIIGFAIIGIVEICRLISFYADGYLKDKCLLDAINELNY